MLLPLLGFAGLALPGSADQAHPLPEETRAEFRAVCGRLMSGNNPFFGTAVVSDLQERLRAGGLDPAAEITTRMKLGMELIRLGRHSEAIELASSARSTGRPELDTSRLLLLAVARLQLAEDQNCVEMHNAASCILPLRPEAVHRLPEQSRKAGDLYLEYLERIPDDLHLRWLLNLTRMMSGDFPEGVPERFRLPPESLSPRGEIARWSDIAPDLGVNAFDLGGGAIIDDFDGDGLLDLVSSSFDPCEPLKAFRNTGHGGFEDVASRWGLDGQLGGLNLVHADYNNDGALDLLVLRGAWMGREGRIRNSLLRNDLKGPTGRFVDVTAAAGLAYPAYPTQTAAWGDYDNDGDLDLYIGNEGSESSLMTYGRTGDPYPSQLYRNNGDGTLTDVARAAGVSNRRFAKGVAWGDYDNDGDPDLYVSNFGDNRLYRNNGDGTFTDVAAELGVTAPVQASFATWFFDYDNDGDLDIFVADYSTPVHEISASFFGARSARGQPLLYRNEGDRFQVLSMEVGFDRPLLPMGANYGDLDNDGWPDLYLGTGVPDFDALMPNVMYRNLKGSRFQDVTFAGGFGHLEKGHGVAFGDLDNDGDQDLYQQLGGAYPFDAFGNALFENPGSDNAWLVLRLRGRQANRWGIGARVEVRTRGAVGQRSFHTLVGSGGSFGGSSLQQEMGLGRAESIDSIHIAWPGRGGRQVFDGPLEVNRFYRATEGVTELKVLDPPRIRLAGSAGQSDRAQQGRQGQ